MPMEKGLSPHIGCLVLDGGTEAAGEGVVVEKVGEVTYTKIFSHGSMNGNASRLVGPPLWSTLKYLNNYRMDCHEMLYRHSCSPKDESY